LRIGVGQLGHHHGAGAVVGHQAADEAADDGALADAGDVVGVRDFTVTSPPITSSAFMPSSVICTARVLGVHSEVTVRRSTPGMKNRPG
jgi:hypothetical protein